MDKKIFQNISALECIIQNLSVSEKERADLLSCLRRLGLNNDDDPVIEITLVMGLLTKLTAEIPEKLKVERVESLLEYKKITDSCNSGLADISDFLKKLEKSWNDSVELYEVKRKGVRKEFEDFSKTLEKYKESLDKLLDKAESIQSKLCFVSWETIMTSAITTLIIIIIFKLMRWL